MGPLIKVRKDGSNAASPGGWLTGVPHISHVSWLLGRDGWYQVLVRHEALCIRVEMEGLHRRTVAAVW